jgi:hypothetical protein
MKKNIKIGLFTIATMFILSIVALQVTRAGACEDICTPKEDKTCTVRGGLICNNFEKMTTIEPITWP